MRLLLPWLETLKNKIRQQDIGETKFQIILDLIRQSVTETSKKVK